MSRDQITLVHNEPSKSNIEKGSNISKIMDMLGDAINLYESTNIPYSEEIAEKINSHDNVFLRKEQSTPALLENFDDQARLAFITALRKNLIQHEDAILVFDYLITKAQFPEMKVLSLADNNVIKLLNKNLKGNHRHLPSSLLQLHNQFKEQYSYLRDTGEALSEAVGKLKPGHRWIYSIEKNKYDGVNLNGLCGTFDVGDEYLIPHPVFQGHLVTSLLSSHYQPFNPRFGKISIDMIKESIFEHKRYAFLIMPIANITVVDLDASGDIVVPMNSLAARSGEQLKIRGLEIKKYDSLSFHGTTYCPASVHKDITKIFQIYEHDKLHYTYELTNSRQQTISWIKYCFPIFQSHLFSTEAQSKWSRELWDLVDFQIVYIKNPTNSNNKIAIDVMNFEKDVGYRTLSVFIPFLQLISEHTQDSLFAIYFSYLLLHLLDKKWNDIKKCLPFIVDEDKDTIQGDLLSGKFSGVKGLDSVAFFKAVPNDEKHEFKKFIKDKHNNNINFSFEKCLNGDKKNLIETVDDNAPAPDFK